jgi:hypothetical protein
MIIGAHSIIYSKNPEADRTFLQDVLKLTNVDAGGGWLIFGLPPSEVAVHPSEKNDVHEFYIMTDNVEELITELAKRNITCGPVQNQGWGLLTQVTLPGGGKLGVYEPRHARPKTMSVRKVTKKRTTKKSAHKTVRKTARRKPRKVRA